MTLVETTHTVQQLKLRHTALPSQSPRAKQLGAQRDLRSLPLSERLALLPAALASRLDPPALALCQVWTCSQPGAWAGVARAASSTAVFRTQPTGCHLSDAELAKFRAASCETGITRSAVGMLGKVWSSGALAVVQNVAIIPTSVHPRNKLDDSMAERLSELAYIPVYDLRRPDAGVIACLEVMMSAFATSALVANVISHSCDLLTHFQLSLGKPSSGPTAAAPLPFASAAGSPFASPAEQRPPPTVATQAAFASPVLDRCSAPPAVCGYGRSPTSAGVPMPPPRLRAVPGTACRSRSGGSPHGSSGSSSSPTSLGTPVLGGPPLLAARSMSMQRTASIRRLDSLADMMQQSPR